MINYKLEIPLEETPEWLIEARKYLATKGIRGYKGVVEYLVKQIKDNIVDTYWSCWLSGHTWYVTSVHPTFSGEFMVYLEDHSKKFGWWDKLYRLDFKTEYPTQTVLLKDFLNEYKPTQKVICKECKDFYDWKFIMYVARNVYKKDAKDRRRILGW
jgi:hypothetical protein